MEGGGQVRWVCSVVPGAGVELCFSFASAFASASPRGSADYGVWDVGLEWGLRCMLHVAGGV